MRLRLRSLLIAACCVIYQADAAERTIYRCVEAGVRAFSDRPCGASIDVHTIDVLPAPPLASDFPRPAAKAVASAPHRPQKARQPADRRRAECVRLDTELRRVAARMRAGYSAADGERLRERQRAARQRRRELQCR